MDNKADDVFRGESMKILTREEFDAIFISEGITNQGLLNAYWELRDKYCICDEKTIRGVAGILNVLIETKILEKDIRK